VRSAYGGDNGLVRDVCSALEALHFTEDRSATATLDCAGSFKYQHDTDKVRRVGSAFFSAADAPSQDLKFVHVFPRVDTSAAAAAAAEAAAAEAGPAATPPSVQVLTATPEQLVKLVARRCPTLSQKKALLKLLKEAAAGVEAAEAKLARLEALSEEEQTRYDSTVSLPEKLTWLSGVMEAQLGAGPLTKSEQEEALSALAAKAAEATAAAAAAREGNNTARAEKLEAAAAALTARRAACAAVVAAPVPVKHAKDYAAYRAQLAELEKIEGTRGLVPLETLKKLRDKPAVEAALKAIEEANRGWFEDPAAFEKRMKAVAKPPAPKPAAAAGGSSGGFSAVSGRNAAPKPKAAGQLKGSNPWSMLA